MPDLHDTAPAKSADDLATRGGCSHPAIKGEHVHVRGARVHNLQNVDLELPKNRLICFTGVSGSGKSSMAFDTIYAEGQRRYVESLSAYARQFLDQMEKPDVDHITGLAPTISIEQKAAGRNPRSTVGTMTEIHDYLRVLYARLGTMFCTVCGKPVGSQTEDAIIDRIASMKEGARLMILAPVVRGRQGEFVDLFEDLQKQGFVRARADGEIVSLTENPGLARHMKHDIDVVVDRIILKPASRSRIAEAVRTALDAGEGSLIVNESSGPDDAGTDTVLGTRNTCCGVTYEDPTPQLFSFNVPAGMCPACSGLGTQVVLNPELLIPEPGKSLREGTIATVDVDRNKWTRHYYEGVLQHFGNADLDTPWEKIPEEARHKLLYGLDGHRIRFTYRRTPRDKGWTHMDSFGGIIPGLEQKYRETKNEKARTELGTFMSQVKCPTCNGTRLRPEALAVKVGGRSLPELTAMPVEEAYGFLSTLPLTATERQIGQDALLEITARLEFLINVGLRYISLDRGANTLSGGEAQRIRLASQIGSGLVGVLYVLDEPSIGLHHRDNHRLLNALSRLRDMGNTVIVVEHDEDTMRAADLVVDFGPGPGVHGGRIVACGPVESVMAAPESVTGQFLSAARTIDIPERRRQPNGKWIEIRGARHNNLKDVTVRIPLGVLTCVTGVSGSGKSSLITDTLLPALDRLLYHGKTRPGEHDDILGLEHVDKVIDIDQSPIGRTPRSNPATYTGVFDPIRRLFADLPQSKVRGYKPGRFSFNVKEGRCDACDGNGAIKVEMDFLADVWVPCPVCDGARFNAETLQVTFRGESIADVLDMDVQEALAFFENHAPIARILQTLHDVGLDYIKLGQPSTTLSGGEAQRVKLAKELCRRSTGKTVYVLDEPTTGLHFHDISHLLNVLHRFCDEGNAVVVIEHNMDVIKTADWIIDIGPEGGSEGGEIVATGTPEEVAEINGSWTGRVLRQVLETGRTGGLEPVGGSVVAPDGGTHGAVVLDSDTYEPVDFVRDISVVGAREHNLKNVSVKVPREKLVVFSGVSGSGKTSLALDTIYAEGQRRYVESLSSYARQFLGQMQKPRVDHVEGLSPAIAIEQKSSSKNPRSTVGTVTEIYDYLRVIFAQVADVYCPECQVKAIQQSSSEVVDRLLRTHAGKRVLLLAPVEPGKGEDYGDVLARAARDGYLRARVDGDLIRIEGDVDIDRRRTHKTEIVIDRLEVAEERRGRIAEAVEAAFSVGAGRLVVSTQENGNGANGETAISQHLSCPSCNRSFDRLTPQMFAFNRAHDASASGMCPACQGMGTQQGLAEEAVIRDRKQSVMDGAVNLWGKPEGQLLRVLEATAEALEFRLDTPIGELSASERDALFYGSPERWIDVEDGFRFQYLGLFPGIDRTLKAVPRVREQLGHVLSEVPCGVCGGTRLVPESRYARIPDGGDGITIGRITAMPVSRSRAFFESLDLSDTQRTVIGEVLTEIINRLRFLDEVGLGYISLDRRAPTLSGGEAQRIRLASQIGSGLTGVLYVLDEPTIGLHPRDNRRLLGALNRLRDLNNTVIVVEHDTDTLNAADHIIDFGPGAGSAGGEIVATGTREEIAGNGASQTGLFLGMHRSVPVPTERRPGSGKALRIKGARQNNLKDVSVNVPLGTLSVVTGVSGSGKSTLVIDVLYKALAVKLHRAGLVPGLHDRVSGIANVDKVILIDQEPIGNSPLSNPATYSGVFDYFRQLYAQLPESKVRGYTARRFSTNVPGGRCERCWGYGQRHIEMHFLPDVWIDCDACGGMRYNRETLDVRYSDASIGDVLRMSVDEALERFRRVPKIRRILQTLADVGLGYLELGRPAPTLSGGEAQRLKLARELSRPTTGQTVYIMDEPTTGLHFADTERLLEVINRLVDAGNTAVIIEHNLDVMKSADHVIDLGPEGGDEGGYVVVAGTPEEIVCCEESHTGAVLREVLECSPRQPRRPSSPVAADTSDDSDAEFDDLTDDADDSAEATPVTEGVQDEDKREDTEDEPEVVLEEPDREELSEKPLWKTDGKAWHLDPERTRGGRKPAWRTDDLARFVETLETALPLRSNWNNRFGLAINPRNRSRLWAWLEADRWEYLTFGFRCFMDELDAEELAGRLVARTPEGADFPPVEIRDQGRGRDVMIRFLSPDDLHMEEFLAFARESFAGWTEVNLDEKQRTSLLREVELVAPGDAAEPAPPAEVSSRKRDERPWKADGKTWHSDATRRREGRTPIWESGLVEAVVEAVEALGEMKTKWDNQYMVSFASTGVQKGTWMQIRTSYADQIRLDVYAGTEAMQARAVGTQLDLDPYDDVPEIPIGGAWPRVNLVARSHGRKALEIALCRVSDVRTKVFRAFLREMHAHFTGKDEAPAGVVTGQPWKDDGKAWHTDPDRERDGRKPVWEMDLATWVLRQAEAFGPLSVKWSNRNTVTVTPGDGSDTRAPYWMTFRTNDWKHLVMTFRCPKGTFDGAQLRREINLRPYGEIPQIPLEGSWWRRVRMNGRRKDWTYVEILGNLKEELETDGFRSFLKTCYDAFVSAEEGE